MKKIYSCLVKHNFTLLLLTLLSLVIPLVYLPEVTIDNSTEVWLARDASYTRYQEYLHRFGSDEFLIIALRMTKPFSVAGIDRQRKLAANLRDLAGVKEVLAIPRLADLVWQGKPGWEKQARASSLLQNLLIGSDEYTVGMLVQLDRLAQPQGRRKVVEGIRSCLKKMDARQVTYYFAGSPRMNVELDQASEKAAMTFMPIAIAVSCLVLFLLLRSFGGVAAVMLAVASGTVWSMTLFALTGYSLNMITVVLPSLLFVLGLSGAIHLATSFFRHLEEGKSKQEVLLAVYREMFSPLFLASITTAVGFASLMLAKMQPVVQLGEFGAFGIIIMFFANILLVPGFLVLLAPAARTAERNKSHWSGSLAWGGAVHCRKTLLFSGVLLLFGCFFASRIRTESNVLKFFPEKSGIRQDYSYIGKNLTGFYTIEMVLSCRAENLDKRVRQLRILAKKIISHKNIARADHLAKIERAYERLTGAGATSDTGLSEGGEKFFARMINRFHVVEGKNHWLRMSIFVNAISSRSFADITRYIDENAQKVFPKDTRFYLTGIVPLLNQGQKNLVSTQTKSFSIAIIVVLIMIGLLFASWRVALAAAIPNLLPIVITFAIMGIVGIALDAATVMIASVAIGIAADDTIHFLARYREEARGCLLAPETARNTLDKIGGAVVFTSLVAAFGFAVLCLADFKPIIYFGFLTGVTMLTALVGDILVLPACVSWLRLWRKNE